MAFVILICALLPGRALTYRDAPDTPVPDFKQDDPRWAHETYSSHGDRTQTIESHGCGICAAANIIAYWFNPTVTPVDMARLSERLGTVAYQGGTYPAFFELIADRYPLNVTRTRDPTAVAGCLDAGGLVIIVYGRHASLIYAHTGEDYWLHDSGWGDDLLSRIMGHRRYDKFKALDAVFYCYRKIP